MRIGLLEPNPALREMLEMALELRGHTALAYTDPFDFLREALARHHDVLLVDDSTRVPGDQVARVLVAAHLPCVLMSTTPRAEAIPCLLSMSDVPFLEKPFHLRDLFAALECAAGTSCLNVRQQCYNRVR